MTGSIKKMRIAMETLGYNDSRPISVILLRRLMEQGRHFQSWIREWTLGFEFLPVVLLLKHLDIYQRMTCSFI